MSGASRSPPTELMLDSSKWLVKAAARFAAYEFIRNIKKVHQEKVRILDERHLQDSCWKRYKSLKFKHIFHIYEKMIKILGVNFRSNKYYIKLSLRFFWMEDYGNSFPVIKSIIIQSANYGDAKF